MALKIGVVGLRGIGNQHAQCHKSDSLANLVAVCDVVKARADAAAEKYGVKAYYDLTEMLKNEELDIVDVTTGGFENGSWHYEPVMEALEAGKNVLVEKPISNNILEARQMVAKAAEKKVYLGCNLNHYFTPTAERATTSARLASSMFCPNATVVAQTSLVALQLLEALAVRLQPLGAEEAREPARRDRFVQEPVEVLLLVAGRAGNPLGAHRFEERLAGQPLERVRVVPERVQVPDGPTILRQAHRPDAGDLRQRGPSGGRHSRAAGRCPASISRVAAEASRPGSAASGSCRPA